MSVMRAVTHRPKIWTPVRKNIINISSTENLWPAERLDGSITYKANRPANVGVEITASSIDVGLGLCTWGPPGEVAVKNSLPNQNLCTQDQSSVTPGNAALFIFMRQVCVPQWPALRQMLTGEAQQNQRDYFGLPKSNVKVDGSLTVAVGAANARLKSRGSGQTSCLGRMKGRDRLRSLQLYPECTGWKISVSSRKYRLTTEEARIGSCRGGTEEELCNCTNTVK